MTSATRPTLMIIVASTRPGRVGLAVGEWFREQAEQHGGFEIDFVDLLELNLPFLDEPSRQQHTKPHTIAWSQRVSAADAFVMVTPEYNHGYNAPLKNAIDFLREEWFDKVLGFVSYGGAAAGTRAAEMLKQVMVTLRQTPVFETVSIPFIANFIGDDGRVHPNDVMNGAAAAMLDEMLRVDVGLRVLRQRRD